MKRTTVRTTVAVLAIVLLSACGSDDPSAGAGQDSTSTSSTASTAPSEHSDADVMFAQMMIPHHGQAVEMSDLLLAKDGIDERVMALAEQIKAAQEPEIDQMTGWLEAWGEDVPSDMGMPGMDQGGDGMMSAEDMQALEDATGGEASRLFLEQMTMHHQGAIEMATQEVDGGSNPDAVALAEAIITAQQDEIDLMSEILASL